MELHKRKERLDRGLKVRTDGIYALMGWQELLYLAAPRVLLIGGLLVLPLIVPGHYWNRVIPILCIYAFLALSFDFMAHYVGLVSLGGAMFIGVGGYLSAILNTELGFPVAAAVPPGRYFGCDPLHDTALAVPPLAGSPISPSSPSCIPWPWPG